MSDETQRTTVAAGERGGLLSAAWMSGALATGTGSWVIRPELAQRRRPYQGRHRHRSHRRDRLGRQRQGQRRQDGDEGYQRGRRPARPAVGAAPRGHRVERSGRGRQRAQADPARQGRRRARRHHQLHAQRDQGRHRQSRPHALHLSAALRRPGVHRVSVLHRADAGAAMRPVHPLADEERRQALRAALGQLCLAASAQRLCAQGDREERRRSDLRGVLPARPGRIQRHRQQDHDQQRRRRVQHRHPARRRPVLQAALRGGIQQARRPSCLRLLRREHAEHQRVAGDRRPGELPRLFPRHHAERAVQRQAPGRIRQGVSRQDPVRRGQRRHRHVSRAEALGSGGQGSGQDRPRCRRRGL